MGLEGGEVPQLTKFPFQIKRCYSSFVGRVQVSPDKMSSLAVEDGQLEVFERSCSKGRQVAVNVG